MHCSASPIVGTTCSRWEPAAGTSRLSGSFAVRHHRLHQITASGSAWSSPRSTRFGKPRSHARERLNPRLSTGCRSPRTAHGRTALRDVCGSDGAVRRSEVLSVVDQVIPFPRSLDDADLAGALAEAGKLAGDLRIQADEIEATERYWIFPIQNIGANGVIVDRTNGHPFLTSGSLDQSTWIWASASSSGRAGRRYRRRRHRRSRACLHRSLPIRPRPSPRICRRFHSFSKPARPGWLLPL